MDMEMHTAPAATYTDDVDVAYDIAVSVMHDSAFEEFLPRCVEADLSLTPAQMVLALALAAEMLNDWTDEDEEMARDAVLAWA